MNETYTYRFKGNTFFLSQPIYEILFEDTVVRVTEGLSSQVINDFVKLLNHAHTVGYYSGVIAGKQEERDERAS